jgi:3-oxoacyl-[acyl-carrier-protein] synthase III
MLLVDASLSTTTHRLVGGEALAATSHCRLCFGNNEGMTTDAPKLLAEGVALASRNWARVSERLEIALEDIAHFALHQVGKANHDAILRELGIPEARALRLYHEVGNVGAAGVPLALSVAVERGLVREGELAMLMGIGSGLNVHMMAVRW